MAAEFIYTLNSLATYKAGRNSTSELCDDKSSHYDFYQFCLIPAVLIVISFAFTRRRKNLWLRLCNGHPGLPFPMNALMQSYRISYACAFGATSSLVSRIILDQYAFHFQEGDQAAKVFAVIGSMLVYGLVFLPLFTSLAVGSVYGYTMGSLYAWMLTAREVYTFFECPTETAAFRVSLIFRGLPTVLCLLYLDLVLPKRAWGAYKEGHYFFWKEDSPMSDTLSDIRISYPGQYVTRLFQKPQIKPPHKLNRGRVSGTVLKWYHRYVYKRKRGFCYPTRIVSVLFVSLLVVYMMTVELLGFLSSYKSAIDHFKGVREGKDTTYLRFREIFADLMIVFVILTTLCSVINSLHVLSSYRTNILALYKGNNSHIPLACASSNTLHCMNSLQFAGYQVGYIIWGYVIQIVVSIMLALVAALFIFLLEHGDVQLLIALLNFIWPIVLTFVLVLITQFLLSKFFFLQERSRYLALDNRGVFFNVTYFMFFYNTFLGMGSCLVRLLKALVLGIFFLGRLDYSPLPRRFETLDPGFRAYVGYLHMEVAHTHPVLVVFCRLMLLGLKEKREREERASFVLDSDGQSSPVCGHSVDSVELKVATDHVPGRGSSGDHTADHSVTTDTTHTIPSPDLDLNREQHRRRRKGASRLKWQVAYTLLCYPGICNLRKEMLSRRS